LYAPAATPAPVVRRLNELVHRAMASDGVKRFVEQNGMELALSTPEELGHFQQAEFDRWGRIIKAANIQPE
jgi:tripartite-type tricarboxylate transporter receptor subunit TctC